LPLRGSLGQREPIVADHVHVQVLEAAHVRTLLAEPVEGGSYQVVVMVERAARDKVALTVDPEVVVHRLDGALAAPASTKWW